MDINNYDKLLRKRQSANKGQPVKHDAKFWARMEKLEEMVCYFEPTESKARHQIYARLQKLSKAHPGDKQALHFTLLEQAYHFTKEKGITNINYLYVAVNNKKKAIK